MPFRLKNTFSVILLSAACLVGKAQKLPNVQAGSLRAPTNVKIDGKTTEWNNQFQAYNHATDINYTLANDNEHLYLIIQATIPDIIRRILNGGITLTINTQGKKEDKGAASITYPVSGPGNKVSFNSRVLPDPMSVSAVDSFVNAKNSEMASKFKTIKLSGIKQLDTLISVYNADDIKVAEAFDHKMGYTYELAISLKHLEITMDNPLKFAYHIKINEVAQSGITVTTSSADGLRPNTVSVRMGANAVVGQSATDFWGEYTLAK